MNITCKCCLRSTMLDVHVVHKHTNVHTHTNTQSNRIDHARASYLQSKPLVRSQSHWCVPTHTHTLIGRLQSWENTFSLLLSQKRISHTLSSYWHFTGHLLWSRGRNQEASISLSIYIYIYRLLLTEACLTTHGSPFKHRHEHIFHAGRQAGTPRRQTGFRPN